MEKCDQAFNRESNMTKRTKLQNRRKKLNLEIDKEMKLKIGAENLMRATRNRKLKDTVALELSFVNSNLQLLQEQLNELNGNLDVYQEKNLSHQMPLIALGLKETKMIDFRETFNNFISEHYSEDSLKYEKAINDFTILRQTTMSPKRSKEGISSLTKYYSQLYFVERRFFPPDRSLGIFFEWYDSLTGALSVQKTVAFEKACVLFNLAAIYSQIAVAERRKEYFLTSSAILNYIVENFANAPCQDLSSDVLNGLIRLNRVQALECDFDYEQPYTESAQILSANYTEVHSILSNCMNIPDLWKVISLIKSHYYKALAHRVHAFTLKNSNMEACFSHLRSCMKCFNETSRPSRHFVSRKTKLLENVDKVLQRSKIQTLDLIYRNMKGEEKIIKWLKNRQNSTDDEDYNEDDVEMLPEVKNVIKESRTELITPSLGDPTVTDLFQKLGPLAIFSAKLHWSAPRTVRLYRHYHSNSDNTAFGFSLISECPVTVKSITSHGLADRAGIKKDDLIIEIDGVDVKWESHENVMKMIKHGNNPLSITVVSPLYEMNNKRKGTKAVQHLTGGKSSKNNTNSWKLSWNPFRKCKEQRQAAVNIILR